MPSLSELLRLARWRVIHRGRARDITVETFNGRLSVNSKDWLIGKMLYVKRSYEADAIRRAMTLLCDEGYFENADAKIMLDVGANIGMISIALVKHGYIGRALAFEPHPDSFRLLTHNVEQNSLDKRIACFPFALSSRDGEDTLELSPHNSGDHRIRRAERDGAYAEQSRRTIQVQRRALDALIYENSIVAPSDVAFIWLDIQGHEEHFFRGAGRFFTEHPTPVISEFWAYGILRSGTTREAYCHTLARFFTHFYLFRDSTHERLPIAHLDKLFDTHAAPRQICELVFVRDDKGDVSSI